MTSEAQEIKKQETLKLNNPNFTLAVRTPSHYHIFLHFLSYFGKKKNIKKARPGFEPATMKFEGEGDNHYTMRDCCLDK